MSNVEHAPTDVGKEFGDGLRKTSKYDETQRRMEASDSVDDLGDRTPPVGLNLRLMSEMWAMPLFAERIHGSPQTATILGLAIVDGVKDFKKFLTTSMRTTWSELTVVDMDNTILEEVDALHLKQVVTHCCDARMTGLRSTSQHIVLRDHLGNCCPPDVDRAIDKEASRITKTNGISFVNITTSDVLRQSPNRNILSFNKLFPIVGQTIIDALRTRIYDLTQLKNEFGDSLETLRGILLEIEPNDSFVIFGEDKNGHGEWFRSWQDNVAQWQKDGFQIIEVKDREGNDSHEPPLRCHRHNVILIKKGTE